MQDKKGKLLTHHSRDIRRDTIGGMGQPEASPMGRWMAKKNKEKASAGQKVAVKLARLSPKTLITMFKKNASLQQSLPVSTGSMVMASE